MRIQKQHRDENKIYYFDKKPSPGPNPLQAELLDAWLDPLLKVFTYTGANRIGKTTIGVLIAISTMAGKFLWNDKRLHFKHDKPRKIRYIGQDWEKHIRAVLLPTLEHWWPKDRPVKKKKNNQGIDALWTDEISGSSLEIMSNLQDSDLHEGWEGDLVIDDEPPKRDIRVANARGLIDREGRELFCMTLLKEAWVDREVIKAVLPDGRPDPTVFNVSGDIYSNVGFGITLKGVAQFEKTLTDDEKSARLAGKPSYLSGIICADWDRKIHLKERFPIPLDWLVDIAIDVHPRQMQAILFTATDPMNQRWVCNEIWDHGDGTWIGENIVRCVKLNSYRVNRIICDPLAKGDKNNTNTTYDKIARVLMAHGLPLETATKDKDSGIKEIKNHLKGRNNEASLFVFDDMVRFIYEIEGWMWDKATQKAQDKDDHMMENLYRTLMLGTKWREMEDQEEEDGDRDQGRSAVGGY